MFENIRVFDVVPMAPFYEEINKNTRSHMTVIFQRAIFLGHITFSHHY